MPILLKTKSFPNNILYLSGSHMPGLNRLWGCLALPCELGIGVTARADLHCGQYRLYVHIANGFFSRTCFKPHAWKCLESQLLPPSFTSVHNSVGMSPTQALLKLCPCPVPFHVRLAEEKFWLDLYPLCRSSVLILIHCSRGESLKSKIDCLVLCFVLHRFCPMIPKPDDFLSQVVVLKRFRRSKPSLGHFFKNTSTQLTIAIQRK